MRTKTEIKEFVSQCMDTDTLPLLLDAITEEAAAKSDGYYSEMGREFLRGTRSLSDEDDKGGVAGDLAAAYAAVRPDYLSADFKRRASLAGTPQKEKDRLYAVAEIEKIQRDLESKRARLGQLQGSVPSV